MVDRRWFLRALAAVSAVFVFPRTASASQPEILWSLDPDGVGEPLDGASVPQDTPVYVWLPPNEGWDESRWWLDGESQGRFAESLQYPEWPVVFAGPAHHLRARVRPAGVNVEASFTVAEQEPEPDPPDGPTVIEDEHLPDGLVVAEGEAVELRGLVTSEKNVAVYGALIMRPGATLRFVDIDESQVTGVLPDDHTHEPKPENVGLWVLGSGVLDVQGTPKAGWNRTGDDLSWDVADELVAAPVEAGVFNMQPHAFGDPAPSVLIGDRTYAGEVANLSRDVTIEGTPDGRAHVLVNSTQPQTVKHCVIRHVGYQFDKNKAGDIDGTIGMYALHFHHAEDGSRGSVVEGVVVRDSGGHAFVPHHSHGILFKDCVVYDSIDTAYWWDPEPTRPQDNYPSNASFDVRWEHCAAFKLHNGAFSKFRMGGFLMGQGERNTCADSVVAGSRRGGFVWDPDSAAVPNEWEFHGNVAHNLSGGGDGINVWQNDRRQVRDVDGLVAYHCNNGVNHGAYRNPYNYGPLDLTANGRGVVLHATASDQGQLWHGVRVADTDVAISIPHHALPSLAATVFTGLVIERCPTPVRVADGTGEGLLLDLIEPVVDGVDMEPSDVHVESIADDTRVRVQRSDGTAFQVTSAGVEPIPAF